MELSWLPFREDWDSALQNAKKLPGHEALPALRGLANSRMDFSRLIRLDRVLRQAAGYRGASGAEGKALSNACGFDRVRLAVAGSSTLGHLLPGIRVAGLRRGILFEIYESPFGTYRQELFDTASGLHRFRPEVVLLALDARHLTALATSDGGPEDALEAMRSCWRVARESFACQVIQQTVLPVFPTLLGDNEERVPGSPAALVGEINAGLRRMAADEGIDLLALDRMAATDGLTAWYDPGLWHHSKHEVHPGASEKYGDHVARLVAAARGRSAKCLVLDLDNTLWGGVIGDDGLAGIVLGQGSAAGEAYLEFQNFVKALAARGVVLAVCSKNDEANAREPFDHLPEMVLHSSDIACFVANWTDKAANLRSIARQLNLGLDSLVFIDDNPVERALVRRELPEVLVPELPDDPARFAATIAAAGYFEGLHLTDEDRQRCRQYKANIEREELRESATDIESYLRSLNMTLVAGPVDRASLARVTQLINKTNQFNLTTRRRSEAEVAAMMDNTRHLTLQARLIDRFGDNGVIAVVLARIHGQEATIENWLMSCRVLGRHVEDACLNVLVEMAGARGIRRLVGEYIPSGKNALVSGMYERLGFQADGEQQDGAMQWTLSLRGFVPAETPISVQVLEAVSS